jgi:hypothetical protein
MDLFWWLTRRSLPVDFQYPAWVARFVRHPFGYFLSLGPKKYHSESLLGRNDFSSREQRNLKFSISEVMRSQDEQLNGPEFEVTCQLPRLTFVEVYFGDYVEFDAESMDLPLEVIVYKLLISWMEPKARGEIGRRHKLPE